VLEANALVNCLYRPSVASSWTILEHFGERDPASIEAEIGNSEQAAAAVALIANAKRASLVPSKAVAKPLLIRAGAGSNHPIIGLAPEGEQQVLVEGATGWSKVAYQGLVGYVAR
jgi:uncharacterized protein YraI